MHFYPELYFLLDKKLEKIYKIGGGLTAYCLIFVNPNIHQNKGKFMYFFETNVKNRHIYHLMSAFGLPKSVLHKQRKKSFSPFCQFFFCNYRQTT